MYLTIQQYESTWNTLRKEVLSHSTSKIALIVSCYDVDAICAARMLTLLLQKDLISHSTHPVIGLESFKKAFMSLESEISNVILVGCGASFDLEELLGPQALESKKVHIFDNHRPWNLENLFGSDKILCYDDGSFQSLEKYQKSWEYLATYTDENSDSGSEDEIQPRKRKRYLKDDEDGDENDDDYDPTVLREKHIQRIYKYVNQGTYLQSTDTVQVYTLLTMLGQTSKRSLWLMVIGVCSLERTNPETYLSLFPIISDEIHRLGGTEKASLSSNQVVLSISQDYALFLMREWCLYDSIMHSSFMSSKLRLWSESGRRRLHNMLARMGVALDEAKQQWLFMNQKVKKELTSRFEEVSALYGIEGLIREGVFRRFGYSGAVSASDCAEAVAALLEIGPTEPTEGNQDYWIDNFWKTWGSLDNIDKLRLGMQDAKRVQQIVVTTGAAIFERKQPKLLKSVRVAVVRDGPDLEAFQNPMTLTRLGVWIAEACSEMDNASGQPIVIAIFNKDAGIYNVLGLPPRRSRDDLIVDDSPSHNKFGIAFQSVADEIHAKTKIDGFDTSVIEIAESDLLRFLEKLVSQLEL